MSFATSLVSTLVNVSSNDVKNGIYLSACGDDLAFETPVRINAILHEEVDGSAVIGFKGDDDFGIDLKVDRITDYTCTRTPDTFMSVMILCDDDMEITLDFLA